MSRAFTIFTKLVMTWTVDQTHRQAHPCINVSHPLHFNIKKRTFSSTQRILIKEGFFFVYAVQLDEMPSPGDGEKKKQFDNSAISASFMGSIKEKRPLPSLKVQPC